ncbi:hypothetical protein B0H63DRAFT_9933 [Podospora didyma]|uniref:Uncharacterized protein n=1 Tax=Podospora didyma TaxID=330526 RepID=A0AAE0P4H2_9PEZI|nr:hypothetical protein B0H63DRAFT_9933 [Podospora didyma]
MKLTPIKLRGRGRKKSWAPPNPKRFKRAAREDEEGQDSAIQRDGDGQQRQRKRIKAKKPGPRIEQLPAEILERIFIASENLNFPRSSLRIGFMLSARSLLSELLVAAFTPTWDLWFGCPKQLVHSYAGWEQDAARFGGNPNFQSAVLACSWANLSLLLDAQQVWYRRHGAGRYYQHIPDSSRIVQSLRREHLRRSINEERQFHAREGGFDHGKDVKNCFNEDWEEFKMIHQLTRYDFRFFVKHIQCNSSFLEIHPLTRIPNLLLTGPFDWEKAKWLYWLIRAGARLSHEQTWELTIRGYESFMKLDDPALALHLLPMFFRLGVFGLHWPEQLIEEKLDEALHQTSDGSMLADSARVWTTAENMIVFSIRSRDRSRG